MANKHDYLIKKEQVKQNKIAAGLLSEIFPKVSGIMIHMVYFQKSSDKIFLDRSINFFPTSHAYFNMECFSKECSNGGFELTQMIKKLVKARKKTAKGKLVCKGSNDSNIKDHITMSYDINIKYKRK